MKKYIVRFKDIRREDIEITSTYYFSISSEVISGKDTKDKEVQIRTSELIMITLIYDNKN